MMAAQYTAQELKTGLSLAVIANVIWGVAALYWVETAPVRPRMWSRTGQSGVCRSRRQS